MFNSKSKSRKVLAAQTANTQAQAWWLLLLLLAIGVGAVVLLTPFVGILLLFGSTALGIVLLVLVVVAITILCIWLGSRMNDKSQENFIAMISQLKGALTASVREESRTQGAYERAKIDLERKQAQGQRQPQPPPSFEQERRAAWAAQFMNEDPETIDGQWHEVDDDYVMDDIV